jgi:hypothetical protein
MNKYDKSFIGTREFAIISLTRGKKWLLEQLIELDKDIIFNQEEIIIHLKCMNERLEGELKRQKRG